MDITRIPAEPDPTTAAEAVMTELAGLGIRSFALPADAGLDPVLPGSGGVTAVWVTAGGASVEEGVVLYVHGGGFEHRMPELMNLTAHRISRATARPVLVVHYRLAPAHPYPAPLDDVVAVYRSLLDQGVPAAKIVIFSESSGATLALSALLALKESGTALPAAVIANSAITDLTLSSPSIDANAPHDSGVDRALLTRLIGQYLGGARPDQAPQSPIHGDLHGLPPLLFTVGAAEALLDDTLRFARAASDAGTRVSVEVYEAMPHVFQVTVLSERNPTGRRLLERFTEWVADAER
ncbi:alpha/beta hydrolase [Streptomyces sp. NBC_01166]|uniref:alpha/beta hydrolase fold domain-containing protein n=1 Tax=Streptomyces sp. NBC_01166 TaxID=2903755 RepID=UPI003865C860|nr:alpha/beta hydrolase [Streptomyces sp. NBC_01166]